MKSIICVTATAVLLLLGSLGHARTPSSSFVPRGPEPHSSLSDKHHSLKVKHSGGSQGTTPARSAPHQVRYRAPAARIPEDSAAATHRG